MSSSLLILLSLCISLSYAYQSYQANIPNGQNVPNPCPGVGGIWQGVGHVGQAGGGDRNVFGMAFAGANPDHQWTKDLCMADSDSDGRTNGDELGDPDCTWTAGQTPAKSASGHPGICEPMSSSKCQTVNAAIQC